MIKTKRAKLAREKLSAVRRVYVAAVENNKEMELGDEAQIEIDRYQDELDFAKSTLETSRALLTKPFESYSCSRTGRYASKRAESYSNNLKLITRLEYAVKRAKRRLSDLKEMTRIDEKPLALKLELEISDYDAVILEETAKIEVRDKKKLARQKADRERAAFPVFIFSKESCNGRRFLIDDLLTKMKKRKGFMTFVNQDGFSGIPAKEFLYILRLHKNSVAEINFAPKDELDRVNVFISYDGGYSKFSFIAHELTEDDLVNVVQFTD